MNDLRKNSLYHKTEKSQEKKGKNLQKKRIKNEFFSCGFRGICYLTDMKEKITITTTKGFFGTFHVCTVLLMGGGFVSRQSENLESLKSWSESLVGKSEKN